MSAVVITEYTDADEADVRDAIERLHETVVALDPLRRLRKQPGYVAHELDETLGVVARQRGRIFVARYDGAFAGFVAGFLTEQSETNLLSVVPTTLGVISDVYVVADRRGSGIGTQLMRRMEAYLIGAGCDSIWVTIVAFNADAHRFYTGLGYGDREIGLLKRV